MGSQEPIHGERNANFSVHIAKIKILSKIVSQNTCTSVYKNMLNWFYAEGSEDFETAVKALKEESVDKAIVQVIKVCYQSKYSLNEP